MATQETSPIGRSRTGAGVGWALLAAGLAVLACGAQTSTPATVLKGVGLSPQGFPADYSRLESFFEEVGRMPSGAAMWNGAWRDDVVAGADAGAIPEPAALTVEQSRAQGATPVVVFGWRSGTTVYIGVPADSTNDWSNQAAQDLFLAMLSDFAAKYAPPFVFVGNENSFYYEQDPADYDNWIAFYNRAYDAIHQASPQTAVGPVFNYEHMAGLGGLNGWNTPHWGALEAHDLSKVDVLGLTVYPWLGHATPDSIPADYLAPLIERIGTTPIAVTETGWPAENLGGLNPPWETSEAAQVAYLPRLAAMLAGKDARMANWLFLYPMVDPGGSPLDWKLSGSISLRNSQGEPRPVYDAWIAFAL